MLVCRKVWLEIKIFLCLWHVRKIWQKYTCMKLKDVDFKAEVLKNMGRIMHDTTKLEGMFAMDQLLELSQKIFNAQVFQPYVVSKWFPKCKMWVIGTWNLSYVEQDTNVNIECYHGNLKATLKIAKLWLLGRWVNWLASTSYWGMSSFIIGTRIFRRTRVLSQKIIKWFILNIVLCIIDIWCMGDLTNRY